MNDIERIDQGIASDQKIAEENYKKAKLVRSVLGTKSGKKVVELLKFHFDFHLTSSALAKFQVNETFYIDGQKSVLLTIDQILEGALWPKPTNSQPEEIDDEQPEI